MAKKSKREQEWQEGLARDEREATQEAAERELLTEWVERSVRYLSQPDTVSLVLHRAYETRFVVVQPGERLYVRDAADVRLVRDGTLVDPWSVEGPDFLPF
jgi:hypothetical protein